jgi:hypothetical protein
LAGTAWPTVFYRRTSYVNQRLRDRYERLLATPDWSSYEIAQLGYSLAEMITRWQRERRRVLERIAWNAETYLRSIDPDNVFALEYVEDDFLDVSNRFL